MRKIVITGFFLLLLGTKLSAQTSNDKVSELIAIENYFAALVKKTGMAKGFLKASDQNTIIFPNGPVKVTDFFKKDQDGADSSTLVWEPAFAKISKSTDWGFTTGPFAFKKTDSANTNYGDYLSVWKKNNKGVWKLALDIGVFHPKPDNVPKLVFVNPTSDRYIHQRSESRLEQRKDIILSSDKLYSTILKADNRIALKEFLADEIRLLFPGEEPIIGKEKVTDFWDKQNSKLTTTPLFADRAYSGEYAYTYGEATIEKEGAINKYNYVRIWQVQPGFIWNVIIEVLSPLNY